ncbi:MAG: rhodanese-like domain-containing protein [Candidatus Binatia bacterium]
MTSRRRRRNSLIAFGALALAFLFRLAPVQADPSKYPAFAQQKLPEDIKPALIGIEELVKELKAGAKPVIVDVRTAEEFREVHILSALSVPLSEFKDYIKSFPRDRLVVLY